jgi:hypothetical protein
MVKKPYNNTMKWIEKHRFSLLLLATFLVLILPAFAGKGLLERIIFLTSMSFLLIQSMIVASIKKSGRAWLRYTILVVMIMLFWVEPFGIKHNSLDIIKLFLVVLFFSSVTFYLFRFVRKAGRVNNDVIMVAVNIYLLIGIISGSLAFTFFKILPEAYNMPSNITEPNFVTFNYYSFVTMSTVGYGDITPRVPETQTLAYLIAVTGQLYVAIIMAFLVGKLLLHRSEEKNGHH